MSAPIAPTTGRLTAVEFVPQEDVKMKVHVLKVDGHKENVDELDTRGLSQEYVTRAGLPGPQRRGSGGTMACIWGL